MPIIKGKNLTIAADCYFNIQRKRGPRWWPWWPLRESDKALRLRCKAVFQSWSVPRPSPSDPTIGSGY